MLLFCADSWFSWPVVFSIIAGVLVLAACVAVIALIGLLIYFIVRKDDFVIEEVTVEEKKQKEEYSFSDSENEEKTENKEAPSDNSQEEK